MFNQLKQSVVGQGGHGGLSFFEAGCLAANDGFDLLHVTVQRLKVTQLAVLVLGAADVQQQLANLQLNCFDFYEAKFWERANLFLHFCFKKYTVNVRNPNR